MYFELKAVKVALFASEETYCFTASLYVDGKLFCTVSNDGHGGCDSYRPAKSGFEGRFYDEIKRINNWIKYNLPPITGYGTPLDPCLETIVGDLLNAHLADKDMRRTLKKCATFDPDSKQISTWGKAGQATQVIPFVKQKHPRLIVLNDLPLEQVRTYFAAQR